MSGSLNQALTSFNTPNYLLIIPFGIIFALLKKMKVNYLRTTVFLKN